MSKNSKIADNPSAKETIDLINAFDSFEAFYLSNPNLQTHFPSLENTFSDFLALKEQAYIFLLPDQFNEAFSAYGWVAYESMNGDVMKNALDLHASEGLVRAEKYLVDSYDEITLTSGILSFNGNSDFKKRIRLAELAQDDYLSGRYHACIPLLLSLLDGLVNDVSNHVGFFAANVDLTAWDCIAAHETGLQALVAILSEGRKKTNEKTIAVPYRHGILHGRELAFDNKVVAAKCWAAMFAARDWAAALDDGKKEPKSKEKVSLKELFRKIAETNLVKKASDEWQPRISKDIPYPPFEGDASNLPANTPELAVITFLDHWCKSRFGPMAEALQDFSSTPIGKRAGLAKDEFGKHVLVSYKVLSVDDLTPVITHVITALNFYVEGEMKLKNASISAIYEDVEKDPLDRSISGGHWRIQQGSFAGII